MNTIIKFKLKNIMQNLTKQQQTDLKALLDNPSQELPESLENVLIDDCLEELAGNEIAKERFNDTCFGETFTQLINEFWFIGDTPKDDDISRGHFKIQGYKTIGSFNNLYPERRLHILLALLSRTPEGEAVMPFLDVYTHYNDSITGTRKRGLLLLTNMQLAYMNNLYNGKSFDEALQIITKMYLINIYA